MKHNSLLANFLAVILTISLVLVFFVGTNEGLRILIRGLQFLNTSSYHLDITAIEGTIFSGQIRLKQAIYREDSTLVIPIEDLTVHFQPHLSSFSIEGNYDLNASFQGALKMQGHFLWKPYHLHNEAFLHYAGGDFTDHQWEAQSDWALTQETSRSISSIQLESLKSKIALPATGLAFTVKQFHIQLNNTNGIQFNALLDSTQDNANIKITGGGKTTDDISLSIISDNLKVQNTPQAQIWINTSLQLQKAFNHYALSGDIHIPKASINWEQVSNRVSESNDVVLIDPSSQEASPEDTFLNHLTSHLRLIIDNPIPFKGFGLDAQFGGDIQIAQRENQAPIANGKLHLNNAIYQFYGKKITLSRGSLLFDNSLLDNPLLALRAERSIEILDSTNQNKAQFSHTAHVGVDIQGTLNEPVFKLFSSVPMDDKNKLSYFLVGSSVDDLSTNQTQLLLSAAQELLPKSDIPTWSIVDNIHLGSAAVTDEATGEQKVTRTVSISKKLTKRLLINYTVGLIEPINTISLQLKLSKNLHVTTSANNYGDAGGDIIFSKG